MVNTLFGLYINVELDSQERNALLGFLNSGVAETLLREYSRTRQTGLEKIEPNDLDELAVIDTRSLPREDVELLAE